MSQSRIKRLEQLVREAIPFLESPDTLLKPCQYCEEECPYYETCRDRQWAIWMETAKAEVNYEAVGEWQSKWEEEHEQLLQKIQQLEADKEHYRKRISQLLQERSWEKWGKSLKLRYELEEELGTGDIEEAIEEVRRLKRLAEQEAANKR